MILHKLDSENEEQFIWRIGQAKDNGEIDISWDELADILNKELGNDDRPLSEAAYRKPYQYAKKFYESGCFEKDTDKQTETIETITQKYGTETTINKDGTQSSNKLIIMSEEESKNPDFVLEAHGFDTDCWQLVSARNTIRQVISKQDGIVTLYASFITVKPILDTDLPLSKVEEFFDRLDRNYSLPTLQKDYSYLHGDKLLLIDIADLHMNLQASIFTTGNEYNCDIAEKLFFHVINDILTRTQSYAFDEIVFAVFNFFLI